MWDISYEIYGTNTPGANEFAKPAPMNGFASQAAKGAFQSANGNLNDIAQVMAGFHPSQIPVHSTLAKEFMVMDRWFASVPGPTQPNRQSAHTATTHGMWNNDKTLLALGFPQKSIFSDINAAGLTWRDYFEEIPSLALLRETRLQMTTNSKPMSQFFDDAEQGKLANYTFLEPIFGELPGNNIKCRDGHAGGCPFYNAELMLKEVYEALRNGPQWEKTLLIITYDEHGGFFDHVPPPANVPSPDGIKGVDKDRGYTYDFTRLGVRVPTILVSPWIAKGSVTHEPKGPFPDSQFEHASIPATLRSIFKLPGGPLTKREEWAGRFDDIFLDTPRTDCPIVLPAALVP
ncbi:phosphoesterase family-domain-containing protein [Gorgonomyces haynaldii]|nr:phosphoesterase family-domain-containing protein [Gorgonomyces haynaldii]